MQWFACNGVDRLVGARDNSLIRMDAQGSLIVFYAL